MSIGKNNNKQSSEKSEVENMALSPNPRANENVPDSERQDLEKNQEKKDEVGSEITDGEDG